MFFVKLSIDLMHNDVTHPESQYGNCSHAQIQDGVQKFRLCQNEGYYYYYQCLQWGNSKSTNKQKLKQIALTIN